MFKKCFFLRIAQVVLVVLVTKCFAIDVFCEFGFPYAWENIGNVYTCSVKNLSVTTPNETVTNILGIHETGKTNIDVHKLNIAQPNICQFIPKGFEKFFPNLLGLRVAQTQLVLLTKNDIKVFPKLRNCDMFNNYLRSLDSDLFDETPEVDYLYFGDNQIEEIGYDIFKPLKNLRKAVFQGNVCIRRNANEKSEVENLQLQINEKCAKIVNEKIETLKEKEREKEEEFQRLKNDLEAKNNDGDLASTLTLLLFIALILCGAISAVYFFLKQPSHVDSDSVENFFHNEMNNEATASYENIENGADNLKFNLKVTPNVMK